MKSILRKNTGLNENNKKKEIKKNSVEKGYFIIGSGGRSEGGGDESGASSDDGDGVDERLKGGKKEEGVVKVEKEGVRQCLSSKCLVEQLPNTLSVSFKGRSLNLIFFTHSFFPFFSSFISNFRMILSIYLSIYLSSFILIYSFSISVFISTIFLTLDYFLCIITFLAILPLPLPHCLLTHELLLYLFNFYILWPLPSSSYYQAFAIRIFIMNSSYVVSLLPSTTHTSTCYFCFADFPLFLILFHKVYTPSPSQLLISFITFCSPSPFPFPFPLLLQGIQLLLLSSSILHSFFSFPISFYYMKWNVGIRVNKLMPQILDRVACSAGSACHSDSHAMSPVSTAHELARVTHLPRRFEPFH